MYLFPGFSKVETEGLQRSLRALIARRVEKSHISSFTDILSFIGKNMECTLYIGPSLLGHHPDIELFCKENSSFNMSMFLL